MGFWNEGIKERRERERGRERREAKKERERERERSSYTIQCINTHTCGVNMYVCTTQQCVRNNTVVFFFFFLKKSKINNINTATYFDCNDLLWFRNKTERMASSQNQQTRGQRWHPLTEPPYTFAEVPPCKKNLEGSVLLDVEHRGYWRACLPELLLLCNEAHHRRLFPFSKRRRGDENIYSSR